MDSSIRKKLNHLRERKNELETALSQPDSTKNLDRFKELSKELSDILPIVTCYEEVKEVEEDLAGATDLLEDDDPQLRQLGNEEIKAAKKRLLPLELKLKKLLIPKDPDDEANVFLEIRAGTGGDEAALFVGELLKMYLKFSETSQWESEIVSAHESPMGGFKEVICKISGKGVYSQLKFESGTHRVQRVPETESQGRVHTSACTVAVLPEVSEVAEIEIQPNELRIDTYRASGAGGQHVNKTDSAIRITHLPSGIVVECQDERSQHKNRARAMSLINAKLIKKEKDKLIAEQASTRKSLIGSGDRSERIRTYNYPQGRITDHRINLTLYKLEQITAGELKPLIEPLSSEHQLEQMAVMKDEPS